MTDHTSRRDQLAQSWRVNAGAWTEAVRSGAIASRRLVTDRALLAAIAARDPDRVLDLGCGEGWLARALSSQVAVVGVDASAPLIAAARAGGGGSFFQAGFDDLIRDPLRAGAAFNVVVANFALLDDGCGDLLRAIQRAMAPGGALIIQTLHPFVAGPPYRDGWRTEDFAGFGSEAPWMPMPWYFRSIGSWCRLLRETGFRLADLQEPVHPETLHPLSLLMVAEISS